MICSADVILHINWRNTKLVNTKSIVPSYISFISVMLLFKSNCGTINIDVLYLPEITCSGFTNISNLNTIKCTKFQCKKI